MEWLRETQWLWWVAGALVLGLVEIASLDLVFFMLAVAAIAAAAAAGLDQSVTVQVLTFVAMAALLLAVLRPVALRKIKPEGAGERTNADALVGRTALVLQEVTDRSGLVKLTGEEWTARTRPGTVLPVDETVHVARIEGATAVVEPLHGAGPHGPDEPNTDNQHPDNQHPDNQHPDNQHPDTR
ncbi:NfeD family protein [Ornithinimicrobium cavernae]|uniref:NfeD family protein n=1 Tax=Ornithinimicrobium cavernae TaxID=2666047 RepID=UPI000D68E222|nr:NfeD family protein [Ornithinimicrobium cavernae]